MLLALECLIHHLSHETALRMDPERQARHDEQREQLMRDCEEENKFEEQLLRDIRTPRKYEAHLPDGWLPAHVLEVRIDGSLKLCLRREQKQIVRPAALPSQLRAQGVTFWVIWEPPPL